MREQEPEHSDRAFRESESCDQTEERRCTVCQTRAGTVAAILLGEQNGFRPNRAGVLIFCDATQVVTDNSKPRTNTLKVVIDQLVLRCIR